VSKAALGLGRQKGGVMNLYLLVSEPLKEVVWEDWFNQVGHIEPYRIAELVVARNRGQAKYLAWKSDRATFYPGDIREMPKFSTRIKRNDIQGPARIATCEFDWFDESLWSL